MAMLQRLSGRSHTVFTAVCLSNGSEQRCEVVATRVNFVELSPRTCAAYLATDEPWDKAGAYAIQGLGGALVSGIHGSYSNVVGLPLSETWQMLREFGVATALEGVGE
jgi:septum formation protein